MSTVEETLHIDILMYGHTSISTVDTKCTWRSSSMITTSVLRFHCTDKETDYAQASISNQEYLQKLIKMLPFLLFKLLLLMAQTEIQRIPSSNHNSCHSPHNGDGGGGGGGIDHHCFHW